MVKHPFIRFLKLAGITGGRVFPQRSSLLPTQSITVVNEVSTVFFYDQGNRIIRRETKLQANYFAKTDLEVENAKIDTTTACDPAGGPVRLLDNKAIHGLFLEDSFDLESDELFNLDMYGGGIELLVIY